jgi:hypothetical protein
MHAHLAEVFTALARSREVLRTAVDTVPEDRRGTRPAPERWSIAEVLEHLAMVDRFFAERIAGAIAEARAAGLGPEAQAREPLPADVFQRLEDRSDRRAAREAVMPTGTRTWAEAWADLDRARQEVRDAMVSADGLALGAVRAGHRFFGSLSMYQWVELTAAHEVRHADQIREAGVSLQR